MNSKTIPLLIFVALFFGGCTPSALENSPSPNIIEPQGSPTKTQLSAPSTESMSPEDEDNTNPSLPIPALADPQVLIETAKEDLVKRLSVSEMQINLIDINQVLWPDTSLGCPQTGNTYTQTHTPGYLIRLAYAGNEFEYHANLHGPIFYCENPTPPILDQP